MKTVIAFLSCIVLIASCTSDNHSPRGVASAAVKNVKLVFPELGKSHKLFYGDTLRVQLQFESDQEPQSVEIQLDNQTLDLNQIDSRGYSIDSKNLGGGYHTLKTTVVLSDSSVLRGSAAVLIVLDKEPIEWGFQLVNTYNHDSQSYTQGLIWHENQIIESAGLYARSDIRRVKLEDGEVLQKERIDDMYFAEGICMLNGEIFQITWREKLALVYDMKTLKEKRSFSYSIGNGEGWGLTHDGTHFIFSDGSSSLFFLNNEDWSIIKRIKVFDAKGDVSKLNELEYVDGKIYANILEDTRIAVINPENGKVEAYWNCANLLKQPGMNVKNLDVMNGIAYRKANNSFLVTGKLWPKLFEIRPLLN